MEIKDWEDLAAWVMHTMANIKTLVPNTKTPQGRKPPISCFTNTQTPLKKKLVTSFYNSWLERKGHKKPLHSSVLG